MSNTENTQVNDSDLDDEFNVQDVPQKDRLTTLKERATQMGISFSPNIGEETLAKRIEEFLAGNGNNENAEQASTTEPEPESTTEQASTTNAAPAPAPERKLTPAEEKAAIRAKARKEALKLVRVIVTPMDPLRTQLDGQIFTAGNSVVGSIAKYVDFNNPAGYMVPQIILNAIRALEYVHHYTVKDARGRDVNRHRMVKAFTITELPPLTREEFDDIRRMQLSRGANE